MASLSFTHCSSLPRWHSNGASYPCMNIIQLQILKDKSKWVLSALPKKKITEAISHEDSEEGIVVEKKTRKPRAKSKKKEILETPEDNSSKSVTNEETLTISDPIEKPKKKRTSRKKVPSILAEEVVEKKVTKRRKIKQKIDNTEEQNSESESSDREEDTFIDEELEIEIEDTEDISFTYGWPPLICCFGALQHSFVPSGRKANRLIDYELRENRKDYLYTPEKFVRAPGGCASNVAIALAKLGGKVAFMGKVGDDDYGQSLVYYLNINNVQTRSVKLDVKKVTSVSLMKIGKRGGLKMSSLKPCAEDCLLKSEINIDVLKEAKMFYFNTFSLLDKNMRSTTLHAIKIVKKLGGVVFYDLNLPLPLWKSSEETKVVIKQAWELADLIEITKQELEFLCEIDTCESFDTKDNDKSKFTHYSPEVISQLWHENLKVLFVTNGTSKIHYYTKEHNGAVLGMEDAPITPYTCDMSASGDGIVAGIMRMLTLQPPLMTDKKYLERSIKYAINCGVIDQWLQARALGYPPREGVEEEDVEADPHGITSLTEREYKTLVPVPSE